MEIVDIESALRALCEPAQPITTTLPEHLYDHWYIKFRPGNLVPMDTTPPPPIATEKSKSLTQLNQEQDTFETILLQLLQTFTHHQRQSANQGNPPHGKRSQSLDISAEALNTLSGEQVMALVTSNSVNYEVIQQIRAQKNGGKSDSDSSASVAVEPARTEGETSTDISSQLLQVSPEQLQLLQEQLAEMLNQQKVVIPADLSPEQQLELIQSLLVQQLNGPQGTSEPPKATAESPPPPKKPKSVSPPTKSQPKPQSRAASKSGSSGRKRREPAKKEPKRPPKPYNIFFGEVYSTVMAANPKMSLTEASKIISDMWDAMGNEVKSRYNEAYEKMEEEYQAALREYQASKQPPEKPSTLQQLLTKSDITTTDPPPPKADPKPVTPQSPAPTMPTTGIEVAIPLRTEPATTLANTQLSQDISALSIVNLEKVLNNPSTPDSGLCVSSGCTNLAVFSEDRGQQYCSPACVIKHCRDVFNSWISNRKIKV